jgi:hypothetical protein
MEQLRSFTVTVELDTTKRTDRARFELGEEREHRATSWAADQFEPTDPRVGDRVTTAEELAALPEHALIVSEDAPHGWRAVYQVWPSDDANRYYGLAKIDQCWSVEVVLADSAAYIVAWLPPDPA